MLDIDDIKRRHTGHFFDRDTMRFFDSRILETVYQGPGGVYFLTSERFHGSTVTGPRRYTVRRFYQESGGIGTFGNFGRMSKRDAVAAATAAAADETAAVTDAAAETVASMRVESD